MSRAPPDRLPRVASRNGGFTLFEVLVALGVCGVMVASFVPVVRANVAQARSADGRLALVMAERSVLEAMPARGELEEGVVNGKIDGVAFRMTIRALPVDVDPEHPIPWQPYRIDVNLQAPDGRAGQFSTIRLGRLVAK